MGGVCSMQAKPPSEEPDALRENNINEFGSDTEDCTRMARHVDSQRLDTQHSLPI
jgi:hypothetical protein